MIELLEGSLACLPTVGLSVQHAAALPVLYACTHDLTSACFAEGCPARTRLFVHSSASDATIQPVQSGAGCSGLKVNLSGLQQNDKPTRDVLVVFDEGGDREFVGFGSAKNGEFADCFLEAGKLPREAIKVHLQLNALTHLHVLNASCRAKRQLGDLSSFILSPGPKRLLHWRILSTVATGAKLACCCRMQAVWSLVHLG